MITNISIFATMAKKSKKKAAKDAEKYGSPRVTPEELNRMSLWRAIDTFCYNDATNEEREELLLQTRWGRFVNVYTVLELEKFAHEYEVTVQELSDPTNNLEVLVAVLDAEEEE